MADIEIVVKINEGIAKGIIDGEYDMPRNIVRAFQSTIADAIKNGTQLPKGHGKLIDADVCKKNKRDFCEESTRTNWYDIIDDLLDYAPTIIKADKGDE